MLYYENRAGNMLAMKVTGPYTFPLHMQLDLEFIYVLEGVLSINTFNDTLSVKKGEMAIIFPNTVHGYTAKENAAYYCAICPADINARYKKLLYNSHPDDFIIPKQNVPRDAKVIAEKLIDLVEGKQNELAEAYFHLLLAKTMPSLKLKSNTKGYESTNVNRAIKYLSENFTQDISLETLSKHLGLNKYTVSHIFSDNIKVGFCAILNAFRIDMAKGLLLTTDGSIFDIALEVGYKNLRSFEIAFKKITGQNPTDFRKNGIIF